MEPPPHSVGLLVDDALTLEDTVLKLCVLRSGLKEKGSILRRNADNISDACVTDENTKTTHSTAVHEEADCLTSQRKESDFNDSTNKRSNISSNQQLP